MAMIGRMQDAAWMPAPSWWARLAAILAAGLVGNWILAAGVTVAVLVRPFDFLMAFLLANGCATFIHYEGGNLAGQFLVLGIASLLMLICYLLSVRGRVFDIPWSPLTRCVVLYVALAIAQYARGIAQGHPWRIATSEFLGAFGFLTTLLIANTFVAKRDMKPAFLGLLATAFGSAALGYYVFAVVHTRAGGFYFIPVPGIVGLFLLNLALRSESRATAFGYVLVSLPLFLHQFLSFRRGVWLGMLVALLATVPIFTGWGRGSGERWRRVGSVFGTALSLAMFGAFAMALLYGQMDIIGQAGARFATIGGTETKTENWSNLARIGEAINVLGHIRQSPWIGHGLGYTYLNTEPLTQEVAVQWQADGNYQLIWLKYGLLGLLLFFWMLWTAFRLTIREARRRTDPWEASWFATAAGATFCFVVFAMFDWPFAQVYTTYLLGLLWGGSIAMTQPDILRFRWSPAT